MKKVVLARPPLANPFLRLGFAVRGHRVVLVDADPQGHADGHVRPAERAGNLQPAGCVILRFRDTMRFVPTDRYKIPDQPVTRPSFFVVPSNIETRNIANSISDAFCRQ